MVCAYQDTWLLSICSHVNISYSGQDHSPCIPHMPGHSLETAKSQYYKLSWALSDILTAASISHTVKRVVFTNHSTSILTTSKEKIN